MCLVQTPYYYSCGHYGQKAIVPRGRCARAERTVGPCWETSDAGIKTLDHSCPSCTRMMQQDVLMSDTALSANDAPGESHDLTAKRGLPVDVNKFNNLVRLHKQTCDRRASIISNSSQGPSIHPDSRRPSAASDFSTTSTASSMSVLSSTKTRLPVLAIPYQPSAIFRIPSWNNDVRDADADAPTSPQQHDT